LKNVGEKVKNEANESLGKVSDNTEKVQILAAEQCDKEMRGNNIILYKAPEANAARSEDRNKHDVEFCVQLVIVCVLG